jgi:outer membrane protein assembly factor BamB
MGLEGRILRGGGPMQLFVSYARTDRPKAESLAQRLRQAGITVWLDTDLIGGQEWWDRILDQLRSCDAVVAAVSKASIKSQACRAEREYATKLGKPILPLTLEPMGSRMMPADIAPIQAIDYSHPDEIVAFRLISAIFALPKPKGLPDPLPRPPDMPETYFGNIVDRIAAPKLDMDEQLAIIGRLEGALGPPNDKDDRQTAAELLKQMAARPDLFANAEQQIKSLRPQFAARKWPLPVVISFGVAVGLSALIIVIIVAIGAFFHSSAVHTWPATLGGIIHTRPFVANGAVYIGDINGHVYALDATTGRRLWTYPRRGHIGVIGYRPQVASGTVYVGSDDGNIYAINGTTGKLRWRSKAGAPVRSSPVYIKDVIYFSSANNNIQALNAKNGSHYWKRPAPIAGFFEHGPAVYKYEMPAMPLHSRSIYVGAGGFLYALNAATGKPLWKQPARIGTGDYSVPAVSPDGKTVYVGGGGHDLYALNTATGKPRWKHPYRIQASVKNQPAVSHGVVYFASGVSVYAVKADGTDYWAPRNFGSTVSGLFVANGSVYIGSGDNIYCLDETTGKRCQGWRTYHASGLVSAPIFNYGKIYFGTQDGKVYALAPDGSLARPTSES